MAAKNVANMEVFREPPYACTAKPAAAPSNTQSRMVLITTQRGQCFLATVYQTSGPPRPVGLIAVPSGQALHHCGRLVKMILVQLPAPLP